MAYSKSNFYKYVAPDVNQAPSPVVEDTVEDVIIDFCQKTSFYRQWLEDHIEVSVDDEEVELDLPDDTAVVEIISIQAVESDGSYGGFIDPDTFMFSNQGDEPRIIFNDPSNEEYTARVRAALRPVVGFTDVPDWIYEDWRDAIVDGVKYRLLAMRSKPWYALQESEQHRVWYEREVRKASASVVLETINKVKRPTSRYI